MTVMGVSWLNYTENVRHNVAQETETHRSNVVNEAVRIGTLAETVRSNQAYESYRTASLNEQIRSNLVNESINFYNATSNRMNAVSNQSNAASNAIQAAAATRNAATNATNASTNAVNAATSWSQYQLGRDQLTQQQYVDKYRTDLMQSQYWSNYLNVGSNYLNAIGRIIPG